MTKHQIGIKVLLKVGYANVHIGNLTNNRSCFDILDSNNMFKQGEEPESKLAFHQYASFSSDDTLIYLYGVKHTSIPSEEIFYVVDFPLELKYPEDRSGLFVGLNLYKPDLPSAYKLFNEYVMDNYKVKTNPELVKGYSLSLDQLKQRVELLKHISPVVIEG